MRTPEAETIVTRGGSLIRIVRYAPGERHVPHSHGRTSVTLVVRGGLDERVGPATERGSALSVVVKPAGIEHADRFGDDGAITLQIVLSPGDSARAGRTCAGLGAWRWVHAGPAARSLLRVLRAMVDGESRGTLEPLLFDALATLGPGPPQPAVRAPEWLAGVRGTLEAEVRPVRLLAAEHGVHPVHLARAFRLHFGLSPTEFRRRARLRRAAGWLTRGDVPLCEAAIAAGYADQAHMSRELRTGVGVTPRVLVAIAARLGPERTFHPFKTLPPSHA